MNLRPLYDRVVIKRVEEKGDALRGGLYIPDSAKEKPQEGEVIAVGKGKRLEDGTLVALDVRVGDRILFGKYSGNDIRIEGIEHMIMREDDILAVLDQQPVAANKLEMQPVAAKKAS
jgi:chaperonin GroES